MIAAYVAASAMFVSCNDEDADPPTIRVMLNGTVQNAITVDAHEVVVMEIEWRADEGTRLDRIELDRVPGANVFPPITSGFSPNNNFHQLRDFNVFLDDPDITTNQTVTYRTKVTDKNGNSFTNPDIVITFRAPGAVTPPPPPADLETPLGTMQTFNFSYRGANNSQNQNPPANTNLGITWNLNTGTPLSARFAATGTNGGFLTITDTQFNNLTTKEEVQAMYVAGYTAGSTVTQLLIPFSGFAPRHFITRSGTTYSKVRMTTLTQGDMGLATPVPSTATIQYYQ